MTSPTTSAMKKATIQYVEGSTNFEQSLDVYAPTIEIPSDAPIVVLVVGSGWLGHRAFVSRPFSFQNSAGPLTIASLGCVCVCVRHRGAFIQPPPLLLAASGLLMQWLMLSSLSMLMLTLLLWATWVLLAHGAATPDEMLDDVARALCWVHRERSTLSSSSKPKLIVGGYSSGGHVAMSLLQRPDKLSQWNLPQRAAGFDGVLHVSGVFATRSGSPLPSNRLAHFQTWLVTGGVFGFGDGRGALPSPLHTLSASPASMLGPQSWAAVPHLLVHCEHEAFGLSLVESALGHLLSTSYFASQLRRRGVCVRTESVQRTSHWTILGSESLREALRRAMIEEKWPKPESEPKGRSSATKGSRRRKSSKSK